VVDKSKQLASRVDLYGGYLFASALLISACEIPILFWSLAFAKFILPIGWLTFAALGVRQMWKAKADHGLSSELGIIKVGVGLIIVAGCGSWACHLVASIGTVPSVQFLDLCRIVLVANGVVGLGLYVLGVVAVWLLDAVKDFVSA
jgi:hypothetical protein